MGYALTPVFFYDANIGIGEVSSASQARFLEWANRGMTLAHLGMGKLEAYDDVPGHYLYTFMDGEWLEFHEAS
jgi:hypothetical protein